MLGAVSWYGWYSGKCHLIDPVSPDGHWTADGEVQIASSKSEAFIHDPPVLPIIIMLMISNVSFSN